MDTVDIATRLVREKPNLLPALRVCRELAASPGHFTGHDINNILVYKMGCPRIYNLTPFVASGILYEVDQPPRSRRRISYAMKDPAGVGEALNAL
jgi:hypothetical protein